MSDDQGPPLEISRELVRLGEVRLAALMALATAADQRALVLAGVLGAAGAAFAAATVGAVAARYDGTPLLIAGAVLAVGFMIAAFLCVLAGAPTKFRLAGGEPRELRTWAWMGHRWANEAELMDATASRYQLSIVDDRKILDDNARQLRAAIILAFASVFAALLAFFSVSWRIG